MNHYFKYTFFLLAVIVLFTNCDNQEPETQESFTAKLSNFTHSDCKNNTKKSSDNRETIVLKTVNSNELKVNHSNTVFNCCPGELTAKFKISGDTIFIDENESENYCNCMCPYDFEFYIEELKFDSYVFVIRKYNLEHFKFTFNFTATTDTVIVFDENMQ